MTLYLETDSGFIRWVGEPINGIRHQKSIAQKWSAEDLAEIGLYKPEPADPIPADKISTVRSVQRVDGVVKWVHDLADRPEPPEPIPADFPLKKWQFMAMVDYLGVGAQIETAIDAIEDDLERSIVRNRYLNSEVYERTDPLFDQIAAQIGMPAQQLDTAWMTIANPTL